MSNASTIPMGKVEWQIFQNIRDWGDCPQDSTHLSPLGTIVGVPTRKVGDLSNQRSYRDFAYHRKAVQSLLQKGLISAKGRFYSLSGHSEQVRNRVYLCSYEAKASDGTPQVEYWAIIADSRRRAKRKAKDYGAEKDWDLKRVEVLTNKVMHRIGLSLRDFSPNASKAMAALNRAMTPVEQIVYGIRFIRGENASHIYWETRFEGHAYTILQPKGAPKAYWAVIQNREKTLNTALWGDGQLQDVGPLYLHDVEPSALFWMTFLAEWLVVPSIYSRRKALVDRLNEGQPVNIEAVLSLNPDAVLVAYDELVQAPDE